VTTKQRIQAKLDRVPEADLDELDALIESFLETKTPAPSKPGILSRLKQISIDAPEDFSANLDQYMNGEKDLGSGTSSH
jgi:hypothetical protein